LTGKISLLCYTYQVLYPQGYIAMPKIVDHEQQRRELSATVASALAELGLENTTLRAVAMRHGCTKGMVQHYFTDKEELLLAALTWVEEQCEVRLAKSSGNLTGLALLHARMGAQLPTNSVVLDEWKVRLAFNTRAGLSPEMRDILTLSSARQQQLGLSCLRQAQKAGELRAGLNLRNSYRSLTALVAGISLGVVLDQQSLSVSTQRHLLKTAIENLRH